ncbi:MAG: murein L,D-transpeptidase, partial [Spirochaetaceae bacterium]
SAFENRNGKIENDADIRIFNEKNPDSPMLRGFGIHGGGYYPDNDWTLGCIAMRDSEVVELYDYLKNNPENGLGTLVIIMD